MYFWQYQGPEAYYKRITFEWYDYMKDLFSTQGPACNSYNSYVISLALSSEVGCLYYEYTVIT